MEQGVVDANRTRDEKQSELAGVDGRPELVHSAADDDLTASMMGCSIQLMQRLQEQRQANLVVAAAVGRR